MNTRLNHIADWAAIAREAKWSVMGMAEICRISTRALEFHFQRTLNTTPKKWLTEQRMTLAEECLREGFTVKETAARLSYKCAEHFSRDFKKHWGSSPTQTANTNPKLRVLS